MASYLNNLSNYDPNLVPSAVGMRFGIVLSTYNIDITEALYKGCIETLQKYGGVSELVQVPGAFELPYAARLLFEKGIFDAIICIGCVIQGDTKHDDYINTAVTNAIMELNMRTVYANEFATTVNKSVPVILGLLTTNTHQQALDRAGGKHGNKGVEVAVAAIKMADLRRTL